MIAELYEDVSCQVIMQDAKLLMEKSEDDNANDNVNFDVAGEKQQFRSIPYVIGDGI